MKSTRPFDRAPARAQKNSSSGLEKTIRILAGQYYDSETGLHYNWFRYYDPKIGRYIRTDPIGFEGEDENLFAYVWNSPLIWIDPEGLAGKTYGKGERGRTGRPDGTPSEYKKYKPHPTKPDRVIYQDADGKTREKAKPDGFQEWWDKKHKKKKPKIPKIPNIEPPSGPLILIIDFRVLCANDPNSSFCRWYCSMMAGGCHCPGGEI